MPVLILHPDGHVRDVHPHEPAPVTVLEFGTGDLRVRKAANRFAFDFIQGQEVPRGTLLPPGTPGEVRVSVTFPDRETARMVLEFMLAHLDEGHVPGTLPASLKDDPRFIPPQ